MSCGRLFHVTAAQRVPVLPPLLAEVGRGFLLSVDHEEGSRALPTPPLAALGRPLTPARRASESFLQPLQAGGWYPCLPRSSRRLLSAHKLLCRRLSLELSGTCVWTGGRVPWR